MRISLGTINLVNYHLIFTAFCALNNVNFDNIERHILSEAIYHFAQNALFLFFTEARRGDF